MSNPNSVFKCAVLSCAYRTDLPYFARSFGYSNGDRLIDGRVTGDVRRIVRQGAQCEGVLVDILAFEQQLADEVSAADVMHQVAEFPAAERVVAEILDDGAAIGVGVRLSDLVFRQSRISLEQEGLDLVGPEQVHDFLVRQNGICGRATAGHEYHKQNCSYTHDEHGANYRCWRLSTWMCAT